MQSGWYRSWLILKYCTRQSQHSHYRTRWFEHRGSKVLLGVTLNCILCQRNLEMADLEWERICRCVWYSVLESTCIYSPDCLMRNDLYFLLVPRGSLRCWSSVGGQGILSGIRAIMFRVDRGEMLWSRRRIEHDLEFVSLRYFCLSMNSVISEHHRLNSAPSNPSCRKLSGLPFCLS